jgi:hypothetical protein
VVAWLDSPGLPAGVTNMACLQVAGLPQYTVVAETYGDICELNSQLKRGAAGRKRKRSTQEGADMSLDLAVTGSALVWPAQLVLLFRHGIVYH